MSPDTLAFLAAFLIWTCLLIYTLTGLADYGGGIWDLLAFGKKADRQQALIRRVLAPIWEVNHIWLIAVVVLVFTCFPKFFAWYSVELHTPLTWMLVGLVFRGACFVFRNYEPTNGGWNRTWERLFGIASLLTPASLGVCLAAVLTENANWQSAFAFSVAALVVAHGSLLAATFLVTETDDPDLQNTFRIRAILTGCITACLAGVTLYFAKSEAPRFFKGLTSGWDAILLHQVAAATGAGLLASLYGKRDSFLRPLVGIQTVALLAGLAVAQYPFLKYPQFDLFETASPPSTLVWTLGIFAGGSLLLVPALVLLFSVFRPHQDVLLEDR